MAQRIPHTTRYLRESEHIAALLGSVERSRSLLRSVRTLLPPPLDAHCLHAGLDSNRLTLVTDSPVWGSRLRFFAPDVLQGLQNDYGTISVCRVRIRPPSAPQSEESGARPIRRLSPETVQNLMEAAEELRDEVLAEALRRLARAGAAHALIERHPLHP